MTVRLRKSTERGNAHHGWLESYHTFSFADYYSAEHMGFSALRVINEDYIEGAQGFPTHGHKDMEIITYVMAGVLEHQDTLGNKTLIRPGEIQIMSAGSGIRHSEYSHLGDTRTHLYQIWIYPNEKNLNPSYGQKSFTERLKEKKFICLASPDGRDDSVVIHQDASVHLLKLSPGKEFDWALNPRRKYWVQVVKGKVKGNGINLGKSDAIALENEISLKMNDTMEESEFLIFDLPE